MQCLLIQRYYSGWHQVVLFIGLTLSAYGAPDLMRAVFPSSVTHWTYVSLALIAWECFGTPLINKVRKYVFP